MKNMEGHTITIGNLKDGESFYFGNIDDNWDVVTVDAKSGKIIEELGFDFMEELQKL